MKNYLLTFTISFLLLFFLIYFPRYIQNKRIDELEVKMKRFESGSVRK